MHSIIDIEHLLALSDRNVFIIYSLHARIGLIILNFDPWVMTLYCLCVTMSYISVLLLFVVFSTSELLNMIVFSLTVYLLKSICNCIMCVCHLIIKDYLLTYQNYSYKSASRHSQHGFDKARQTVMSL